MSAIIENFSLGCQNCGKLVPCKQFSCYAKGNLEVKKLSICKICKKKLKENGIFFHENN